MHPGHAHPKRPCSSAKQGHRRNAKPAADQTTLRDPARRGRGRAAETADRIARLQREEPRGPSTDGLEHDLHDRRPRDKRRRAASAAVLHPEVDELAGAHRSGDLRAHGNTATAMPRATKLRGDARVKQEHPVAHDRPNLELLRSPASDSSSAAAGVKGGEARKSGAPRRRADLGNRP